MKSKELEEQIARIHELLESENAQVTWNDRIPDPDNPQQNRQIDITVKSSDSFIIIECRLHRSPQDVQWIEELIGRRESLRADSVIAVSSSGFTEGAERKAKAFGVILRNFSELSEEEIRSWGKKTLVTINFLRFEDLIFNFLVSERVTREPLIHDKSGNKLEWIGVLNQIINQLADITNEPGNFSANVDIDQILVNGKKPFSMQVEGAYKPYKQALKLSSVYVYGSKDQKDAGSVYIQKLGSGKTEIIDNNNIVKLILDCSNLDMPRNTLFQGVNLDFGRGVMMRDFKIIGIENAINKNVSVRMIFKTVVPS